MPTDYISALGCDIKYISHTHLKVHIWANITKPMSDGWVHIVGYYKFNTISYQRFGAELWVDPCAWLRGKSKHSFVFDWTIGRVLQYSNLNHPCPYEGHIYVKFNNLSTSNFPVEPLIPSGKYRIDVNVTNPTRKTVFATGSIYLSVSDRRVEIDHGLDWIQV